MKVHASVVVLACVDCDPSMRVAHSGAVLYCVALCCVALRDVTAVAGEAEGAGGGA